MDYSNLLQKSLNISWKHKILWILGFFAASSGFFSVFEKEDFGDIPAGWFHNFDISTVHEIGDWLTEGPLIAIGVSVIGLILLLVLGLFIMQLISVAGLIEGVNLIEQGREYKLKELFKTGGRYFWRFLGLFFISLLVGIIMVMLLIGPVVIGFIVFKVLGLLILIFIIPIGFAAVFFFGNIYSLAQREMVIYDTPLIDSITEGFRLLIKHVGPNIIIFLITLFLWMAIVISGVIIFAIFAIPIAIFSSMSLAFLIISLVFIIPVFLAVAIIVEGFLGTFFNSFFTLFYLALRKLTPKETVPSNAGPAPAE